MTSPYTQKWIEREDLRNNPDVLFLFGDNTIRKGMGGQAGAMRGEPNACGVATKMTPTSGSNAYFSDDAYEENCRVIFDDLQPAFLHRAEGGMVVIPADGLGTGLSELPERAPLTNAFLVSMLKRLQKGTEVSFERALQEV